MENGCNNTISIGQRNGMIFWKVKVYFRMVISGVPTMKLHLRQISAIIDKSV